MRAADVSRSHGIKPAKIPDITAAKPGAPKQSVLKSVKEGFSYVANDRPLRALLLVAAVLNLFS